MTKMQMYLIISTTLTMLPNFLVTASPILSLTRDNAAIGRKYDPKLLQYLVQYGYLDDKLGVKNAIKQQPNAAELSNKPETKHDVFHVYTDDEISNGIKSFQTSLGLKVSGDLDDETRKMMKTPRCGVSDEGDNLINPIKLKVHHRSRRYTIRHGGRIFKWSNTTITWSIQTYYSGLSQQVQEETFEKAFKVWEYASPLLFVRQTNQYGHSDMRIHFYRGYHGDSVPFDGRADGYSGGLLGHAFLPGTSRSGDIHFDADEIWTPRFLLDVAIHEIGHAIGLGHSSTYSSVMYPAYIKDRTTLYQDDKDGLKALYGECQTKIDAVIAEGNGDIYFIRSDLIWKYDGTSQLVKSGYPKKVNDEFPTASGPKIPSDLDCASRIVNGRYVFIKDANVYVYDINNKRMTVKTLSQFWRSNGGQNVTKNILAAVSSTFAPIGTWLFKGDLVWSYDDLIYGDNNGNPQLHQGYPKKISRQQRWSGLPKDIDDGILDERNGKFYFFKDTEYWVLELSDYWGPKHKPAVTHGGFIHDKWKGICSAKYQ